MLIAEQGFDLIFKPLGDAAEAIADGFALLFFLASLAAFVVMVIVIVVGAASAISLLVHGVVTGKRLVRQRYREKGPTITSPLLTLPGLVTPAVALVFMLKHGVLAEGWLPLVLFLLSMAILLFVWFAPWAQHVRAISQDRNVSVGVALRQVAYQNRLRFLMTINLPVLLVSWVTAAISNWTGIPLLLFLLSVGVLLFVWFAPWAQHVPALIGRAKQRLNAETPDIEGALADIGLAEQVDSTAAELKPAKALAHVKRAIVQATDGKISEPEKDLKEAESLGASDTQLTPVRQSLAAAYLKQAEEAAQSGNASQVFASTTKAVEYDESISIPVAIVIVFADESVKQFEQSSSEANKNSALAAIAKAQGADADLNSLEEYRRRVGAVLLTLDASDG